MKLYLASASPRRHELLTHTGIPFTVLDPAVDESERENEAAAMYVERMAKAKVEAGFNSLSEEDKHNAVVLAADTIVVLEDQILGKPESQTQGQAMLRALSGRSHVVMTAIGVKSQEQIRIQRVSTTVFFRTINSKEVEWYWNTGEPVDKAGGYAIQGIGGVFINTISGSVSSVIGLPLVETLQLLKAFSVEPALG